MAKVTIKNYETIRTTVNLPVELVERSEQFIEKGSLPNRNTLIVAALEHFLTELERQEIDKQFEAMANDVDYQALNEAISEQFSESDWEALLFDEATQQ